MNTNIQQALKHLKYLKNANYLPTIITGFIILVFSIVSTRLIDDTAVWWVFGIGMAITILLLIFHERYQTNTPLLYIPNVWTGLGVLATFFVIWNELSKGIDLDEAGFTALVQELAKAFSSSIVGISTSLASAITIKIFLSMKEHQHEKNNKEAYTSPEETLWDLKTNNEKQLGELKMEINKLYNLLNESSLPKKLYKELIAHKQETQKVKELLFKIPTDFKEQLETLLDNLNTKLESEIGAMGESALLQAQKNIEEINKDLKNVMTTLLTENKNQLETTLTQLKETGEASKNTIDSVGKLFSDRVDGMNTHYEKNARSIETKFESVAENFNTMNQGLQKHYEENANAIQGKFQELTDVFSKFDEQIQNALATTIDNGVINLDKALDRIKEWQVSAKQELETISNSFKKAVDEYAVFKDANKGIIEELREQTESLQKLKEEVSNIPEYDNKIEGIQNRISEIGTTIEELGKIKEFLAFKSN